MNLRHIDEFLEKHSAGWKPFKGDFRIGGNPLKQGLSYFSKYTPFGGYGAVESAFTHGDPNSPAGSLAGAVGYNTPAAKGAMTDAQNKAIAEADAAVKQAEFEASKKAGLERLALKRKKGFGGSMIVNPSLGSTSPLGS